MRTQKAMFRWIRTDVFWAELRQVRLRVVRRSMASETEEQMEKTMLSVRESK